MKIRYPSILKPISFVTKLITRQTGTNVVSDVDIGLDTTLCAEYKSENDMERDPGTYFFVGV